MAKGSMAKQEITKKILEMFEGSFVYNDGKEIRVPILENGEVVQIKVTLTAAKVAVSAGSDQEVPGAAEVAKDNGVKEITKDEKNEVSDLITALGL